MTYSFGDCLFVGDTLFMPDYGAARCDFPGGSAEQLYSSIQRLYAFSDDTRMFLNHDYLPKGRTTYIGQTTVGEQKMKNILISASTTRAQFVEERKLRDSKLPPPRLILPSLFFNLRAGQLPNPEPGSEFGFIKIPINFLGRKSKE
eukprot:TRINITY_DN12722_c0_g1_i1.p1 TRINITY_DN12722_c0_g1~~TRINITY_DN12722_c0_g1_i1.p1  ORF type:complete len:146 (-),score=15.31 TRINITY_DN12722_c0_g1_i1:59-496(-)